MPYELLLLSQLAKTSLDRKVLVVSDASPHIMASILLPDERKIPLKLVDMTIPKRAQPRLRRMDANVHSDREMERARHEKGMRLTKMGKTKKSVFNRILGRR